MCYFSVYYGQSCGGQNYVVRKQCKSLWGKKIFLNYQSLAFPFQFWKSPSEPKKAIHSAKVRRYHLTTTTLYMILYYFSKWICWPNIQPVHSKKLKIFGGGSKTWAHPLKPFSHISTMSTILSKVSHVTKHLKSHWKPPKKPQKLFLYCILSTHSM